jgi:hypothetical protein
VLRSAYAIQTDSPNTGQVIPLAQNPPFATPVSFSPTAKVPYVSFTNAYQAAGGIISPNTITNDYKNDYIQSWNLNVQQQLAKDVSIMVGYFGVKGTHLNIQSNLNQPINGVRPYTALSSSSPIDPGKPLGNITLMRSSGNSSYNALWLTATKRLSKGLQFNASYTYSKSLDYNSKTAQGIVVQNSYDLRGDYGLSDFDARHRLTVNGIYDLPFTRNRDYQWRLYRGGYIAPKRHRPGSCRFQPKHKQQRNVCHLHSKSHCVLQPRQHVWKSRPQQCHRATLRQCGSRGDKEYTYPSD